MEGGGVNGHGNSYMGLSRPALETFKREYEASRDALAELRRAIGAELTLVSNALAVARPERGEHKETNDG